MGNSLRSIFVTIGLNAGKTKQDLIAITGASDKSVKSFDSLGRSTDSLKAKYNQLSSSVRTAAQNMTETQKMALGAAMTGFGYAARRTVDRSTQSFAELDTAMARVRKTTGMTKDEIEVMRAEFINMSKEVPTSAAELAAIGAVAGQLNITGKKDILDFTKTIEMMAVSFDMSAEASAVALAKMAKIYDIDIAEADRLASAINVLGNTTEAFEYEIVDFTMSLGAGAKMMGFTATESVAMGATLISMGRDASSAGTLLNATFTQLSKNVSIAAELLGMTDEKFKEAFGEDQMGTIKLLLEELDKIEDPFERSAKSAEIFSERGGKAMKSLIVGLDDLNENLDKSAKGYEDNIALIEEYANATDTFASKQKIANSKMEAARIEMGEAMAPAVLATANALGGLAWILEKLPWPLQTVLGLTTYIAQGLLVLGPLILSTIMLQNMGVISTAALGTALMGLATAVWAVLAPLLPLIAAGALVALIVQDFIVGLKGGESAIFKFADLLISIPSRLKGFGAVFKDAGKFLIDSFIRGMTFGLLDTDKLTKVFSGIRDYL
ncbi:phage tail tape measure protein, partial [bacterium]|nr:phage tail tape measure protein [bacterium]